jgi:hypothetical protein
MRAFVAPEIKGILEEIRDARWPSESTQTDWISGRGVALM